MLPFADQDSVQMLQRSTQVGEFYRMSPPAVYNEKEALPASYMDLLIYDEESDKLAHIPFEQALYATCAESDVDISAAVGGDAAVDKILAAALKHMNAAKIPDGAIKKSDLQAGSGLTVKKMVDIVATGVYLEICIVIARPFIEHHMLSAVAAVSGRDTGATLYGPADMCVDASSNSNRILNSYHCIRLT
jgi:hypothetical protein